MQFSLKRVLGDGTILSVLISIIVYGSIYVNPTMWIGDYPPDIQEAVGSVEVPTSQKLVVGVLFLCIGSGQVLTDRGSSGMMCANHHSGDTHYDNDYCCTALPPMQ